MTARSQGQIDEVAAGIRARGGEALAVAGDVTSWADVQRVVKAAEAGLGPVTLLVNNAGVPGPFGPLFEIDPERWWAAQGVHIKAPMMFIRAVMPGMVQRKGGRIILVSALAARMAAAYMSAYCTGKIAQSRLVEEAALEGKDHGVCAFAIDPGFVFTGIAEETMNDPAARKWLPMMAERLKEQSLKPNASRDLERCAQRCVDLASGRYDGLTGRYMELPDDLDAMLQGARPHWQTAGPPMTPSPENSSTRR